MRSYGDEAACLDTLFPDAAHERILLVNLQAEAEPLAVCECSVRKAVVKSTRTLRGAASTCAAPQQKLPAEAAGLPLQRPAPAAASLLPSKQARRAES